MRKPQMKAAVYNSYGAPEVLRLTEVDKPEPSAGEILVKIEATAVNSGDVRLRKADPFAVRFMMGLIRPRIPVLGGVFSGYIESVGPGVTRFKPGDEVFGSTDMKFGAYAAYKCFPESGTLSIKPGNISHAEAAVIPFGGTTALYFLRKAGIQPGQHILIYGASGAVGSAAVQLAKHFGARVTAVCSGANNAWVKALGADRVIDYSRENWLTTGDTYDVIYDTVNRLEVSKCFQQLHKNGVLILGAAGIKQMLAATWLSKFHSRKALFGIIKQRAADIQFLASLVDRSAYKPVIDRTYSLDEIVTAHTYVEQGHKKGNVAIIFD